MKRYFALLLCLISVLPVALFGQSLSITGPSVITFGTTNLYQVTNGCSSSSYCWSVNNNATIPTSCAGNCTCTGTAPINFPASPSVLPNTTVTVTITVTDACGKTGTLKVTVVQPLSVTLVSIYPKEQSIAQNTIPAAISLTGSPTGSVGSYTYQWYKSSDYSTWSVITGATGLTYSPGVVAATTYYKALVTSGPYSVFTDAATVTTYTPVPLSAPVVTPATQTINYNTDASQLTSPAATGGTCNGAFVYQWQRSSDNNTWSDIAGAASTSYKPTALTASEYFRLKVVCAGEIVYTSSVTVFVTPVVTNPSIQKGIITPLLQTINYNMAPEKLTSTAPSGGNGVYTYQWQQSPDSLFWQNVPGATQLSLQLPAIIQTTFYKLVYTSNGESVSSAPARINVYPQLLPGLISIYNSTINYGEEVGLITSTPATGGNATYTYQWQYSADNISWTNISGATGAELNFGNLQANSWVHRMITSNGVTVNSNDIALTVVNAGNKPDNAVPVGTQPEVNIPAYVASNGDDMNYIRSYEVKVSGLKTLATVIANSDMYQVAQSIAYIDGLGRPVQTIMKQASPDGYDIIQPVVYDKFNRSPQQYLAYIDNLSSGQYRNDADTKQKAYYDALYKGKEGYYYANSKYDGSPLNEVVKTSLPGISWTGSDKGISTVKRGNVAAEDVRIWTIGSGSTDLPVSTGNYSEGTLMVNETIDENNNRNIEYTNREEQLVLRKTQAAANPGGAHAGWLCTYYVYDELNNLRAVITPKAVGKIDGVWSLNAAVMDGLCYQYAYDGKKRLIRKKVPGADYVEMVYDIRNRLIFSQDGLQRAKTSKDWMATFYDNQDRAAITAIYKSDATRESLQGTLNNNTTISQAIAYNFPAPGYLYVDSYDGSSSYVAGNTIDFGAGFSTPDGAVFVADINPSGTSGSSVMNVSNTLSGLNQADLTPLTFSYYDDYTFTGSAKFNAQDVSSWPIPAHFAPESITPLNATYNLLTGIKVRVLDTEQWLTKSIYYDGYGHLLQSIGENENGGKSIVTNQYSFLGKPLNTNYQITNPRSAVVPSLSTLTLYSYNQQGNILTIGKRFNGQITTIKTNTYDDFNVLKELKLGAGIDNIKYDHNLSGWITGINRDFVNTANSSAGWFGEAIAYDQGFDKPQYNGNISGIIWKSGGDGVPRSYGFGYDNSNRLVLADFSQQNPGSTAWTNNKVNFSVNNLKYDLNGNILSMRQTGQKGVVAASIDELQYKYIDSSNMLQYVRDNVNDATSILGDFKEPAANNVSNLSNPVADNDYSYDKNGNLTMDLNRGVNSVTYNILNLPAKVVIAGKGTITYQYDALGTKLKKIVVDNTVSPAKTTTSEYIDNLLYVQDTLQYISHEEGRIRPVYNVNRPVVYTYDYFEKDHLDNVRVVLGTEKDTSVYSATMETGNSALENALFSNINTTRDSLPAGYPVDATTNPNKYVAKLNAVNGQKIGPALVLRVMTGDTIQIGVKAFYKSVGASSSNTTTSSMLAALIQAFSGSALNSGAHMAGGSNSPLATNLSSSDLDNLMEKDPNQNLSDKPKAYLNYVLFDDLLNMVDNNSGVKQVQGNPDELQTISVNKMVVKKSGFIYIYTSNQSGENVYFDNLVVVHNNGPLLEETNYYPFGLTMAGISSTALKGGIYYANQKKYNGNELQSKELADGSGLEWFDFNARTYDQQVGRFMQIDPLIESGEQETMSPYHFAKNNPVKYNDPDGKCPTCLVGAVVGFVVDAAIQVSVSVATRAAAGKPITVGTVWGDYSLVQGAAAAGAGFITAGLSAVEEVGASLTIKTFAVQGTISVWRQRNQNPDGNVYMSELLLDALPVPEGPKRTIQDTRQAEKAVVQAGNRIEASTSRIPARKISQKSAAEATLKKLEFNNNVFNATGEAAKVGAAKNTANETRKAADGGKKGSGKPLSPEVQPPAIDNTKVKKPDYL